MVRPRVGGVLSTAGAAAGFLFGAAGAVTTARLAPLVPLVPHGGAPPPPPPPGGGAPVTAAKTVRRPPPTALPASAGSASTDPRSACLSWATEYSGCWASTSAAAPVTCGVAIEVPSSHAQQGGVTVPHWLDAYELTMFTPGAPRSTLVAP